MPGGGSALSYLLSAGACARLRHGKGATGGKKGKVNSQAHGHSLYQLLADR